MRLSIIKTKSAFTLIELLVVIGILTVLLAIVLIAINPARQFSQANDTQRRSDVNALLNSVHQYAADNKGALPGSIPTSGAAAKLCKPVLTCNAPAPAIDYCAGTTALAPKYVADIPRDPKDGTIAPAANTSSCAATTTAYDTKYTIISTGASGGNRITVCAAAEITPPTNICVTR